MNTLFELLLKGGIVAQIIAAIFSIIIILLIVSLVVKALGERIRLPGKGSKIKGDKIKSDEAITIDGSTGKHIWGGGGYRALVLCLDNIARFTTIPEPIGDLFTADPSCPVSGSTYLVQEIYKDDEYKIVDFNPSDVPIRVNGTPSYAWIATHWEIVDAVYSVPMNFWEDHSFWFAVGISIGTFITLLGMFGG